MFAALDSASEDESEVVKAEDVKKFQSSNPKPFGFRVQLFSQSPKAVNPQHHNPKA